MKKTIKKIIYFVGLLELLFSLLPVSYAVVTYAATPTPAKVTLVSATVTKADCSHRLACGSSQTKKTCILNT